MADEARGEEIVARSGLDWTVVRPGGLTDGPHTGEYVHGVDVDATAGPISRADVADFLLWVVEARSYLREAPVVTTERGVDAAFLGEQVVGVARRLLGGEAQETRPGPDAATGADQSAPSRSCSYFSSNRASQEGQQNW